MKGEGGQGGGGMRQLGRWLGAPVRALSRACDSYARKMSACAGRMPTQYAGAVGGRGGTGPGFMQTASFSSRTARRRGGEDEYDVGELVRAMSTERRRQQERQGSGGVDVEPPSVPARSWKVATVTIDEDAPFEFGAGDPVLPPPAAVRRTRSSVAVGGGNGAAAIPARAGRFRPTKNQGGGVVRPAAS